MTNNVGIYIFDAVEVLDFAGPFEVFTTASRVWQRHNPNEDALFNTFTLTEKQGAISARGNLKVEGHYPISRHPNLDLLIVPGGIVTKELEKEPVLAWIKTRSRTTTITAAVCTGAFLLAKSGVLKAHSVTTHFEDIGDLKAMFPKLDVKENTPFVDNGNVVTSAGISAGIDMSLYLVSRLADMDLAQKTARQMEYTWTRRNPT